MAEEVQYSYNPKTGKWEPTTSTKSDTSDKSSSTGKSNENSSSASSSTTDSKSKADKEYIETEFNTLQGDLNVLPTKKTLSLKSGETIKLVGFGKYLSGLYYITAVKKSIDSSGFSITISVIKTGFGDSLKSKSKAVSNPDKIEVSSSTTFKVGDKVKFLTEESNKYIYSNAHEGVKVPKWVTQRVHTVDGVSDDGRRVRLKEIWSWTYVKFLKKA